MKAKWEWFLQSNDTWARLLRTICQSIFGVLIANLDVIFESVSMNPSLKPVIVAIVMCILSPIMKELGVHDEYSDSSSGTDAV